MPDGRIEPRQVERLKQMGDWLNKYGQTIYKTRGGLFKPSEQYVSTHAGNKIYLHILDWPSETLSLPPIGKKIKNAKLFGGGKLKFVQSDDAITISVDQKDRQAIDTVVEFEVEGQASEILPLDPL